MLLVGRCEGDLYPLKSSSSQASMNKQALVVVKLLDSLWHSRLGHASSQVVQQILSHHKLPYVWSLNNKIVCDACEQGKSHQLLYPRSSSVSSGPFDLIHLDVWRLAPTSVGRHSYYVSFIDNCSKFTCIYLLRYKSKVFQPCHHFQKLVEGQLNRKILTIQTDWGRILSPTFIFKCIGITHHVSCPHAHQQNGSTKRKHRHIIEVGLLLLAHASVPLKFWHEAFLIVVFLIN
jgi:histone deacetylase 1/2